MKLSQMPLIIAVIVVGLLLILTIQVLWLNESIGLRRASLQDDANKLLGEVVFEMEQQQVGELVKNVGFTYLDSSMRQKQKSVLGQKNIKNLRLFSENELEEAKKNDFEIEFANLFANTDSNALQLETILTDSTLIKNKSFFNALLNELKLSQTKSLAERINFRLLDSLINKGIADNQLNKFEYTYQIVSENALAQLKSTQANTPDALLFTKRLFESDYLAKKYYLTLTFSNIESAFYQYIRNLLFVVGTALVLVVGGVFFLIKIIRKQRLLSDIKTDFINNMTHELKTPISTITLATETIIEVINLNYLEPLTKIKRYAKIIEAENARLGKHVEHILTTTLLEKNDFELNMTAIHLHTLVQKVINQLDLALKTKNTQIKILFNAKNDLLLADELHLTNVFYNILDNAIKYSTTDLKLEIETKNTQDGIVIRCTDNGIGINVAQQKRIFEKFYRVSTGNLHNVKGFGLGLSYSKNVVLAHKGSINLLSEPKKGSSFVVFLPNNP